MPLCTGCQEGWDKGVDGRCYRTVATAGLTYDDAVTACSPGTLVSMSSEAVNAYVRDLCYDATFWLGSCWIGLRDAAEGQFKWQGTWAGTGASYSCAHAYPGADATVVNYTNWLVSVRGPGTSKSCQRGVGTTILTCCVCCSRFSTQNMWVQVALAWWYCFRSGLMQTATPKLWLRCASVRAR